MGPAKASRETVRRTMTSVDILCILSRDRCAAKRCAKRRAEVSAPAAPLDPAAHAGFVVTVSIAKAPFQVCLLACDDAVADDDCKGRRENKDRRAMHAYADAGVDEEHAQVDGIAGPAVNAGRHQRAGGLPRGYWRPC